MSEAVNEKVEELKSEESFDLSAALKGVSYPTDDVTIFLDGEAAHEYNETLNEIAELGFESSKWAAAEVGGITDAPEKEELDAQIAELEELNKELLKRLAASRLTFTIRGAATKQWKLIIKSWKRKGNKLDEAVAENEEERQQWVSDKIDCELLAKTIVKTTNAKGQVNKGAVSLEWAEELKGAILESEWAKLQEAVSNLTFANGLFQQAIASDADFLSQP